MADNNGKNLPNLRELDNIEVATILKARESWSMFSIMSEFVETTERLSTLHPAVTIFGSARIHPDHPDYIKCVDVAHLLSNAGFAVISGGGPGIMAAANRGAFEGKSPSVGLNIVLAARTKTEFVAKHLNSVSSLLCAQGRFREICRCLCPLPRRIRHHG